MTGFEIVNWGEVVLWPTIGVVFFVKAIGSKGERLKLLGMGVAFFVFGLSDYIELQTGAWWRPFWLLLMKGACIAAFLWGAWYYRSRKLERYLEKTLPSDLSYDDLAQLCQRLYCTVDGIPEECLSPPPTKERIARAAAWVSRERGFEEYPAGASLYGATFHKTSDKGHWLEVIGSILKMGNQYDSDVVKPLLQGRKDG